MLRQKKVFNNGFVASIKQQLFERKFEYILLYVQMRPQQRVAMGLSL